MIQELPVNVPHLLAVRASGKLTDADYKTFLPRLRQLIREQGRISLLVELVDFEGWEAKAAWDDLDFGLEHDRDFERIAIAGEKSWHHWMTALSNLLARTPVRFFSRAEIERAWEWLNETASTDEAVSAYRHILLATDFSAHSRRAARRAFELAGRYRAKLSLIHVVEDLTLYDEFYDPIAPDRGKRQAHRLAQARIMLDELARDLGGGDGLELRCQVVEGAPKSAILAYAREHDGELIVVGSHGHGAVRRLLGSVADAVSHGAGCDVLTVHL